jgi:SAM-dependent methyltransferase
MTRRERAIRLLPPPLKALAKSVRYLLDPVYKRLYRRRTGYTGVIAPGKLRARSGNPGVESFVEGGAEHAVALEGALATVGRTFRDANSVLDFGCGAGRVLPHVIERGRPDGRFAGFDVDAEAIAWAAAHHPRAEWAVSRALPPLPAEDDRFDLVYSISIFTHLDERTQRAWLQELARVLAPGGVALLTTHGDHAFAECQSGRVVSNTRQCAQRIRVHGSLDAEGFIHEPYTRSRWIERDYPGVDPEFGMAFHSDGYIQRVWSEYFDVKGVLPQALGGWQDIVVVQRPASGPPA